MVGTTSATGYSPGTLSGNATYYWRVVARNSTGSTSSYTCSFTTLQPGQGGGAGIALVQSSAQRGTGVRSLSVPFASANTTGNLIIAAVRMSTTSQTVTMTDSSGNVYTDAVAQSQTADGHQVHLFYARNVAGGANTVTAVVTGKPVEMGGSLGRREATGRGCMIVTREALARLGMPLRQARVAVQGFGNVGSIAADLLAKEGATIIAVADKSGGLINLKGLDIPDVVAWVREHRQLAGYPRADSISNEDLLTTDCDVLLPAALENVITSKNAKKIKAKVICEGANGPTTANADKILEEKGVLVIPDILANAGGVTVSYFEWVQDRGGYFWDEETVNHRLETIITRSFKEVVTLADKHKVTMRVAAYMLAIDRVATMHRLRGMYA